MSLFTDTASVVEVPSMPVERLGRYVLHRAGIRNVWQYDDLQLVFAGGRLLLRGKNGAGKSKAMEMLLPFLLDGDTRNLDSVARDRTKLDWLMTDGRESGNHIGYMWLELRAVDADSNEEFRTLGCGVKVAPSTRKPTVWFFYTTKRVGEGLHVADATGMIAQDAFRDQLEADEYFPSSTSYARRVAKDLFGIDDEVRYRNLCHLLYELRRPSVGENIEAGQHTKVLTEALPPLDDDLLVDVAGNFDDLKKIRDDLARAEQSSAALGEFLNAYRGYTRSVVRERAGAVTIAADEATSTRRKLSNATAAEEKAYGAADDAQRAVDDLDATVTRTQGDLQVLAASPAYQTLQSLDDRRRRVHAIRLVAVSAEASEARAAKDEVRAATAATRSADDAAREAAATSATRRDLEPLVAGAGLDALLLPAPVTLPVTSEQTAHERIRRIGGGDTVERHTPRRIDVDDAKGAVTAYLEMLTAVARHAEDRRINVANLLSVGREVETKRRKAQRATEVEADAEARVDAAEGKQAAAVDVALDADCAWRTELGEWATAAAQLVPDVDWSLVFAIAKAEADRAAGLSADNADEVSQTVDAVLASPRQEAVGRLASVEADKRAAATALAGLEERRVEVEGRPEKHPAGSRYRRADRDTSLGVPLYALIDLRPGVDPLVAAGAEAALEASGLLDAWVSSAGTAVDPRTHDVVLASEPLEDAPTLAAVLAPALPPGSPVDVETVEALLRSVAFDSDPAAASSITGDGRWRLGVARGAWSKDTVEFIGVGARRAARNRELEELDHRIGEARRALDLAESDLGAAERGSVALDALARRLPPTGRLRTAAAMLAALTTVTARERAELAMKRTDARAARDSTARADRDFSDRAARANLPADLDELRGLDRALEQLSFRLRAARPEPDRVIRALATHSDRLAEWQAAVAARVELEGTVAARRSHWETEAEQLATLEDTHGDDVRAVEAKFAAAQADLKGAEQDLPAARRVRDAAARLHILAEEEVRRLRLEVTSRDRSVEDVAAALRRVLATPGLALAAFGASPPPLTAPERANGADDAARIRQVRSYATAVVDAAAGGAAVSDSAILNRYATLAGDSGLAAGYEPFQDETAEKVKVFGIHDETGTNPVAVVAERLAREVTEAQGRLTHRQEEVFQRFLLGEIGDHLRHQLNEADHLVAAMNRSLANVRTSHGLGVKLDWHLSDDVAPEREEALPLLREASAMRRHERTQRLGELLGALIEAERLKDPTAPYEGHLRAALDYRSWHTFTIRVVDAARPGRDRKLSKHLAVSQGEQRVLAYLSLFSGASAYFDSLRRRAPKALRVILLDDAFAKIDEPTHGRLLELLVEFDLDFLITSERVTGCVPGITLEVYECLRDPRMSGVAVVHTHWDGHHAQLQAV